MTLTLELTPAEKARLRREAARRGQEVADYAHAILLPAEDAELPAPGESVYDSMNDYIGMFRGGEQTSYSENTGQKFAEALLENSRYDRL